MNDKIKLFFQLFKYSDKGPSKIFWSYGTYGILLLVLVLSGIGGFYFQTSLPPLIMSLIGIVTGLLSFVIAKWFLTLLMNLLTRIHRNTLIILGSGVLSLLTIKLIGFSFPDNIYFSASFLTLTLLVVMFGSAGLLYQKPQKLRALKSFGIIIPLLILGLGVYWLWQNGEDPYYEALTSLDNQIDTTNSAFKIAVIDDPSTPGIFKIDQFTYGSGKDARRKEYAEEVRYTTPSVDASKLLTDWKGKKKKWRERYWDFGIENFPLNGRVYMPLGEGPFPLILIVHGNHSMLDYSDGGYAYLGKMLASRGFITVSVDQNYINAHWSGDFRGKEMTTRAWLLLKHLELWKEWNQAESHDLFSKIDMNNIMLVGHSRGGEAVAIAAAFNKLPVFPDDANEVFDFNFNIKGIVSIAPTDYRYSRRVKLKDINLLTLQGSYDADETSFWGMRQYNRTHFSKNYPGFKAALYIHGANHGQFNTSWGRTDFGAPLNWLLNTQPIINGDDQRTVASVLISTFAEATLHNDNSWKPIFENVNFGFDWLPKNYYLSHYSDPSEMIFFDFEDDLDLTSGKRMSKITTRNLKIWQETDLMSRDKQTRNNNFLLVGWDYGDTIQSDSLASILFSWPASEGFSKLDSTSTLLLTLATGDPALLKRDKKIYGETEDINLKFQISLYDSANNKATISSDHLKRLAPRLKVKFTKVKSFDENFGSEWEIHPEDFQFPFEAFIKEQGFNYSAIKSLELIFNKTSYGVLAIDNVGFK